MMKMMLGLDGAGAAILQVAANAANNRVVPGHRWFPFFIFALTDILSGLTGEQEYSS
jgi:hypothetical protein